MVCVTDPYGGILGFLDRHCRFLDSFSMFFDYVVQMKRQQMYLTAWCSDFCKGRYFVHLALKGLLSCRIADITPVQCSSTVTDGVMRPTTAEFQLHLPAFLVSNPEPKCAKGGHAAYAQVIETITAWSRLFSVFRAVHFETALSDSHITSGGSKLNSVALVR
jgi:hypothetical protein